MQAQNLRLLCAALTLLVVMSGCGPGNPLNRQAVSGKVAMNGQSLDHGSIEFAPQQPGGVGSGASIDGGNYEIPIEKGLPPGKYLVRIYSAEEPESAKTGEDTSSSNQGFYPGQLGAGGQLHIERVPKRYNVESELLVEVTANGPNKFLFELDNP